MTKTFEMHKLPGQAAGARCSVHGSKHPDMHSSELENLHHFQTSLVGLRASSGSGKPFLVPRSQGCTAELCFPAWEEQRDPIICCSLLLAVLILPSLQSWRAPCSLSTDTPDFAWQSRKQGFAEKTSGRFPVSRALILTWLSGPEMPLPWLQTQGPPTPSFHKLSTRPKELHPH